MLCELGNSVSLLKCVVTHEGQGLKLKNEKDEGFNIRSQDVWFSELKSGWWGNTAAFKAIHVYMCLLL